jgi:hypothetical protein
LCLETGIDPFSAGIQVTKLIVQIPRLNEAEDLPVGLAAALRGGLKTALAAGADGIFNTDVPRHYEGAAIASLVAPIVAGRKRLAIIRVPTRIMASSRYEIARYKDRAYRHTSSKLSMQSLWRGQYFLVVYHYRLAGISPPMIIRSGG